MAKDRKVSDIHSDDDGAPAQVASAGAASRAWLLGAYTFLLLWGTTFLVLYFTDRLPI